MKLQQQLLEAQDNLNTAPVVLEEAVDTRIELLLYTELSLNTEVVSQSV
jgi:hypothetical protein